MRVKIPDRACRGRARAGTALAVWMDCVPGFPVTSSSVSNWMEPAAAHAGEVRKLSTLLETSQALSSTLDLKEGLQRVLEILGRHHGAIRSTVVLLNEETKEVEVEASAGRVTAGKRARYRIGEGITGKVVQTGKPIVVPRVSREPTFLNRAADRPELPEQELDLDQQLDLILFV